MISLNGTLTYQAGSDGSPYSVINQAQGVYTALPGIGQVISQGQVLYGVNDSPVVLLYGLIPAYRTLSAGSTGADVAQLNADLVALGYATQLSSAQLPPPSGRLPPRPWRSSRPPWGWPRTARWPWPGGVRTHRRAGHDPVRPARGQPQTGQTVMVGTSTTRQVRWRWTPRSSPTWRSGTR